VKWLALSSSDNNVILSSSIPLSKFGSKAQHEKSCLTEDPEPLENVTVLGEGVQLTY
jgi:hypothetical protein